MRTEYDHYWIYDQLAPAYQGTNPVVVESLGD
jgi:hypothetical protein